MNDPPREMRSIPPALPGPPVRPPPVQRSFLKISQLALLAVALGSFVAGILVVLLLLAAIQSLSPVAAPAVDEDAEEWVRLLTADQEELERMAFAVPPYYWSYAGTDSARQCQDFDDWSGGKFIVSESYWAVENWLFSAEPKIDRVVTNEPTGAQYRVTGTRGRQGAACKIEFVGNLNWK